MTKKIEIKNGLTNKSFKQNNKFIQIIIKNKFNHNYDYANLAPLDFVPKLLKQTPIDLAWEFIVGKKPQMNKSELIQIGQIMRKTHLSNIKLPSNNLAQRINHYLKIINDKQIHIAEIHDNFIPMNKLMKNMGKLNPCHNDVRLDNLIKDKNNKMWLVDWEYATMGDRHFDIAYFIESSYLSDKQEQIFLEAYKNYEIRDYEPYQAKLLPRYKKLVNYIILLWMHAQDELPFSDKLIRSAMHK